MPKANLVFFGTDMDSRNGLKRSLVSFLLFFALSWVWFGTVVSKPKPLVHVIAAMSLALVLASAIGVYLPNAKTTSIDVIIYSALVGFVVSIAIASALVVWADKSIVYGGLVVLSFVLICAFVGWLNYKYLSKINF